MDQPLWQPSPNNLANHQITCFSELASKKTGRDLYSYQDLHEWSIQYPEAFWQLLYEFTDIKLDQKHSTVVESIDTFPGTKWFPDAKLNFAKNLLRYRDNHPAIISKLEGGYKQTITYAQLYEDTAKVALWLKYKIKPGDRVAAILPNIPETIVSMLGTTANGGVWSSCSPDFGVAGALDRFGQIEPTILFACTSYNYGGKTFDVMEKVVSIANQIPSLQWIVWVDPEKNTSMQCGHVSCTDFKEIMEAQAQEIEFTSQEFCDPLYIMFSSGTTGTPKCITHSIGGTLIQHLKEHRLHVDLKREDRFFFFTTCGWMMWNWLVSGLASGSTIVLYDGSPFYPGPEALINLAQDEKISVFGVSAKYLSAIEKSGVEPNLNQNLENLRCILSTGSPLTSNSFHYVYNKIKRDVHLASISGGTDILGCFLIGNPCLPVWDGEIQCAALGVAVDVFDSDGNPLKHDKGELVCTKPIPSYPIGFWNDINNRKLLSAYFDKFGSVWAQGDYAEKTKNNGFVIHGRSDAVLNPGGVRIGTAEIYKEIDKFNQIVESVCIGQSWEDDTRIILFVVMQKNVVLDQNLISSIKSNIKENASPKHVPSKIIAVGDVPKTRSGKIAELAVREIVHGNSIENSSALSNPESLANFMELDELDY